VQLYNGASSFSLKNHTGKRRKLSDLQGQHPMVLVLSFSRDLLMRAVAYRMQELALGGLRPEPQRRLRQIAQEFRETGSTSVSSPDLLRASTKRAMLIR
jgi:hypothetical protein